jgi:hypothetical protein
MKYYSYNEYTENSDENLIVTVSEEEIRQTYYPWWYKKMCEKYGEQYVDENFCFPDCLEDWIITNYAWEVEDG